MTFLLFLLLQSGPGSLSAVPQDAMIVVHVENPLEAIKGLQFSSLGKFFADEQIQNWLGLETDSSEIIQILADKAEVEPQELEQILSGPVSMWFTKFPGSENEEVPEFMLEFQDVDPDLFEKFARKAMEVETSDEVASRWVEDTFQGTTIFTSEKLTEEDKTVEGAYALIGRRGYMSPTKSYLETALAKTPTRFGDTLGYKPEGNVWAHINFPSLLSALLKEIPVKEGEPISAQMISNVFGLDAISAVSASIDLTESFSEVSLGIHYSERAGIMKLLALLPKKYPTEPVIPLHAHSFNATNFDLNQMWTTLESIIYGLNPEFETMLQTQMDNILRPDGEGRDIHLRENLLQGLGTEWYTYNTAVQSQDQTVEGTVAIVNHRGQTQLEKGMDDLLYLVEKAGAAFGGLPFQFVKIEFQGHPAYQLTSPMWEGGGATMVITERWALLGGPNGQVVTEGLAQLQNPTQNVWNQPKVRRVRESFNGQPVAFGFGEINSTFVRLLMTPFDGLSESEAPSPEYIADMFGSLGSAYYMQDQKIIMKVRLFNVP